MLLLKYQTNNGEILNEISFSLKNLFRFKKKTNNAVKGVDSLFVSERTFLGFSKKETDLNYRRFPVEINKENCYFYVTISVKVKKKDKTETFWYDVYIGECAGQRNKVVLFTRDREFCVGCFSNPYDGIYYLKSLIQSSYKPSNCKRKNFQPKNEFLNKVDVVIK